MQARSIDLIDKALKGPYEGMTAADWCRELEVNRTALTVAKVRGKLSPVMAGNLARLLGEDVVFWVGVAALENAEDSHPKHKVLECFDEVEQHHKVKPSERQRRQQTNL